MLGDGPAPAGHESAATPFVGRESEIGALLGALRHAEAGHGGLVLLAGAPGIGKTRTVEELLARAAIPAARALRGRCTDDAGAPAYWPWIQVLRGLAAGCDDDRLRELAGDVAGELARLLPALRERIPGVAPAAALDPEQARFRLFDAVALFLGRAAARAPVVVVLDDLHLADDGSLHLLSFVAREARTQRLLLLATCGEAALRDRPLLLESTRSGQRIALRGLVAREAERLLRAAARRPLSDGACERLHRAAEGNPFFLEEMLRSLEEGAAAAPAPGGPGAVPSLPGEVRDVVARHLAPLSDDERRLLSAAAAIGGEFDVVTLQAACELAAERVLDLVDAAARAGIVEEVPGRLGRHRFRHAFLRDALYEGIAPAERAAVHLAIARALEGRHRGDPDPPLDELAFHFHAAAPPGEADKAVAYSVRAAQRALAQLAYEKAVKHYERARDADALRPGKPVARVRLLLGLAEAVWHGGDHARARPLYEQAAAGARSAGDPLLLGLSAVGFSRSTPDDGAVHPEAIALLEEALAAQPEGDTPLRAFLLSRLAIALYFTQDRGRVERLSLEAVDAARRIGSPRALIGALITRHFVLVGPDRTPKERLAVIDEALRLARDTDDRELEQPAHAWRVIALLEMGDAAARSELAEYCRLWMESRLPVPMWHARVLAAAGALLDGRLAAATLHALDALSRRPLGLTSVPSQFYALQMFDILAERGSLGELEGPVRALVDAYPAVPGWRCFLAALLLELGRRDEARATIERLAARGFADMPRDGNLVPSLAWLAEGLGALGERSWTEAAYSALEPLAERNVVVLYGCACRGSVSRSLGLLAASLGRSADAERHLEAALAMNLRIGARALAARTRCDLARVLLERGTRDAIERAAGLAAEARLAAAELRMARLAHSAADLEAAIGARRGGEVPTPRRGRARGAGGRAAAIAGGARTTGTGRSGAVAVLQRDAGSWTVGLGDETFRLADMKGLAHLARLVAEPGRDFPALELARGTDAPAGADASAVERARVNATRAIAAAVKRIAELSPALGRHLAASVHTGLVCAYRPDPDRPVVWRL